MQKVELVSSQDVERMLLESLRNNELPDCFLYLDRDGLRNYLLYNEMISKTLPDNIFSMTLECFRNYLPAKFNAVCITIGNGAEEGQLLVSLKDRIKQCFFIDICPALISLILSKTAHLGIDSTGLVSFVEDLEVLSAYWNSPILYCLLGNRFCNYEAESFLESIAMLLGKNDFFLFNCPVYDSGTACHTRFEIEQKYKSLEHVRYNASVLLCHGARIDDFQFHLDLLLSSSAAGPIYRTRKRINFLKQTRLQCSNGSVDFKTGEHLSMGSIYRYSSHQLLTLVNICGLSVVAQAQSQTDMTILCKVTEK
ncbi:MAG: hypothetical protein GX640_20410 [Fibrobacter sp.]|nr:hypothetical protein [Fibrobacter sp.]